MPSVRGKHVFAVAHNLISENDTTGVVASCIVNQKLLDSSNEEEVGPGMYNIKSI